MRVVQAGLALALASACVRIGYDPVPKPAERKPDASQHDGGAGREADGAVPDAAAISDGSTTIDAAQALDATNPTGGTGEAGAGGAGSGGAGSSGMDDDDAGVDVDDPVGDTGLRVSDILGFYSGHWGDMVLRQQGKEIWGTYQIDNGTIVGQITSNGVFVGWWSQTPTRDGADAGEVEFRWSQPTGTAIELDGRWRYQSSGEWLENWDIDLVTDRAAPPALIERFNHPAEFRRHP